MVLKKKNIEVQIPLLDSKVDVLAFDVSSLKNKIIKLDMTRKLMGKSLESTFKINVNSGIAEAVPLRLALFQFYIRRLIRKSASYIEDSFLVDCKNGKIRVKTFMITRKRVPRTIRNSIRKKAREIIADFCKDKDYEDFFKAVLSNSIQKEISTIAKKIYPLAVCEVKEVKVEKK